MLFTFNFVVSNIIQNDAEYFSYFSRADEFILANILRRIKYKMGVKKASSYIHNIMKTALKPNLKHLFGKAL